MSDSANSGSLSTLSRPMQNDDDFWRVHTLLLQCYSITPLGFNWNIRRWEGKRFYNERTDSPLPHMVDQVQLWETPEGRLVAVVNPEGKGDAHLQIHPGFRFLEEEMVAWAETHLSAHIADDSSRQLEIFAFDYDTERQETLSRRGFVKTDELGVARRLHLDEIAVEPPIAPPAYTLRSTRPKEMDECQRIADLLNAAFNRTIHNGAEYQNFSRLAPCFRADLDLVAVAPDGTFAAYVGIPYDEENRCGIFEPVCTHPDHRRRGLARTLMLEGLRRLKRAKARDVIVETGAMRPANRLYNAIGFSETCRGHVWRKLL